MITLSWISSEANKWNTFVANRMTKIHRITNKDSWCYIRSEENPAHPLSRGMNPKKLELIRLWWEERNFLHHDIDISI